MAALNADAELPPVYDLPPEGVALPYGTFAPPSSNDTRRLGIRATREVILLDWWGLSREVQPDGTVRVYGNSQVAAFAARARVVLDGTKLALGAGIVRLLRWDQDVYVPDPDRDVRHVQQRYRVGVDSG